MNNRNNGFLYPAISLIIKILFFLNIIEIVKTLFSKLGKSGLGNSNNLIDSFILTKFIFIFSIFFSKMSNPFIIWISIYLGFMNIFTYFYYHCWHIKRIYNIEHSRRRFIALFFSFLYNIFFFSYIYIVKGSQIFKHFIATYSNSILVSIANAFGGSTGYEVSNNSGNFIINVQIITSFIYVVLLISQSLPVAKKD